MKDLIKPGDDSQVFTVKSFYPGLPRWLSSKESACNLSHEAQIRSLDQRDPLEKKWQPTLVFLPGKSLDRGAWWATVHGVTRVGHDLATKPPPQGKNQKNQ